MVNQGVAARYVYFEFNHSRTTCRNDGALYVFVNQFTAFNINFVEDFADYVEGRYQVRTTVTNVHTYSFACFGFQGVVAGDSAYVTVKYYVFRLFGDGFIHIERLQALCTFFTFGVEVALNDVEFFIHFRQTFFRFNQNQTVHTVGDVHTDGRNGAVVDIQTGLQGFEAECRGTARGSEGGCRAAARTGSCVEVNVMRNGRRRIVREFHFYCITFAYANHATRNIAVKCPVVVLDAIIHFHGFFDGFHFHADFGRVVAVDCRRYFWSVCGNCIDNGQFACRSFGSSLCSGACSFSGSGRRFGRGLCSLFATTGG